MLVRLFSLTGCRAGWSAGCRFFGIVAALAWMTQAAPAAEPPWSAMDYGPFLTASIDIPGARTNIAYKGIAVNLARGTGSTNNESIVFDTDLLRYGAGWSGSFVALKGIVFDGEHWAYPRIDGRQVFSNPPRPGWKHNGRAEDPRAEPYGPLPRTWGHWKGLFLHGDDVLFSYSIGDLSVLEFPALERRGTIAALTRTLNLGAMTHEAAVLVATEANPTVEILHLEGLTKAAADTPAVDVMRVIRAAGERSEVLGLAVAGAPRDARWTSDAEGSVWLQLPPSRAPSRLKIFVWRGTAEDLPTFAELVTRSAAAPDLAAWTHGGPARWPDVQRTDVRRGEASGPLAIDELTAPDDNPWHSWMRFGGLDFFGDAHRAALSTWNGDVWVVSGVDDPAGKLAWRRIATGLFQPLGVKIVDDVLYVLGRDQITRLHDLNGDGEADWYENFNNDALVSEHFHEFANDLKTGSDGDFYYLKCARHALPAVHSQHGTLIRVSRDGSRSEVVARGFRAVNGLGIGPHDEFTTVDNQGHWMPANRLNWVKPGGWYGNQWAWNPEQRTSYDAPLCWIHNSVDRSGGTHLWVPPGNWGPFQNQLITLSYGMGEMFLVLKEQVGDRMQGAVTRFPIEFETGVMRGVFHPATGDLYASGLFGWAGNKTKSGAFYRIRATGRPWNMPVSLHMARDGVVLGFTDPLDASNASDPGSYDLTAWNYRWSAQYGSPDLKQNGKEGRDTWRIDGVQVSADRRTVFLKVPDLRPVMQWNLAFRLKAADGSPVQNIVHGTIHQLGDRAGADWIGPGAITSSTVQESEPVNTAPGLLMTLERGSDSSPVDARVARLAAMYVPAGTPPSPFLEPGGFLARWDGFVRSDVNGEARFVIEAKGKARLRINDALVLELTPGESKRASQPVRLRGGWNAFRLEYDFEGMGDAACRVSWSSSEFALEPIPATAFAHPATDMALRHSGDIRNGRSLFVQRRCQACHVETEDWGSHAMPEIGFDAPSFEGIGARLQEDWMAHWILNPRAIRADAHMPRLLEGKQAGQDARDLAAFLAQQGSQTPSRHQTLRESIDPKEGSRLFQVLGCVACHVPPGEAPQPGDNRLSLALTPTQWKSGALADYLRQPNAHDATTRMPDFHLDEREAAVLAAFLESAPGSGGAAPKSAVVPGDPKRGEQLATALRCYRCHRLDERQSPAAFTDLARLVQEDWQGGCLADDPHQRGGAPDLSLSAAERQNLRALRAQGPLDLLKRDNAAEFVERQFTELRCGACHERDGRPDSLSAFERELLHGTEENPEGGSVHVGRPSLTFAGEKLQSSWIARCLAGTLEDKTRPDLPTRMPAFPAYAQDFARGLASQHGYSEAPEEPLVPEPAKVEIGRRLTGTDGGFGCVTCHGVGSSPALAGRDTATINFAVVAERLRESYYRRYVKNPTRLMPGTMMPRFIDADGRTGLREIFDGDSDRQFEAIWHYLHSLDPATAPVRAP